MPPPPSSKFRVDTVSSSLSSSRKRSNNNIRCAPRTFFAGISIAACGLLVLSVYLTTRLDRSLPTTSSSSDYDAAATRVTAFDGDTTTTTTTTTTATIRPVICNELLKDPTIWDPSKLL